LELVANMLANFDVKDLYAGDPEGEPFAIRISAKCWIPISIMIFAKDEDDAKQRILNAIKAYVNRCSEQIKSCNTLNSSCSYYELLLNRCNRILEIVENGGMKVERFDKRYIAKVPWAANDYLV